MFEVAGFSFIGSGESVGIFFIRLKDSSDRKATAAEFIDWAYGNVWPGPSAMAACSSSTCPSSRVSSQFRRLRLLARGSRQPGRPTHCIARAEPAAGQGRAKQDRAGRALDGLPPAPRLKLTLDRAQAQSMGLADRRCVQRDPAHARARVRQRFLLRRPRVARADAGRRAVPHERGLAAAASIYPRRPPPSNAFVCEWRDHERRHGAAGLGGVVEVGGRAAVACSASTASRPCNYRRLERARLQLGRGHEGDEAHRRARICRRVSATTGPASRCRRSGARAPKRRCCSALSILVVFLCLAALYESWATPIAVLLVVPVGIIGAIVRGLEAPACRTTCSSRSASSPSSAWRPRTPS